MGALKTWRAVSFIRLKVEWQENDVNATPWRSGSRGIGQDIPMIKLVTLLKRRPDLSVAHFRAAYETRHVLLGLKYTRPEAVRYTRRYLGALRGADDAELCFDVVMELWFTERAALDRVMQRLQEPEVAAEIAADEELLFDRSQTRFFIIEDEVESIAYDDGAFTG